MCLSGQFWAIRRTKRASGASGPGGRRCLKRPDCELEFLFQGEPMTAVQLPHATCKSLRILGKIREAPEDFRVEEIPAYGPSGRGDHLLVHFEKTGLTTPQAVRALANALDSPASEAGWAGLKDRVAITRQWASFAGADPERASGLELAGIRVLEAARHGNKLRTGHLRGNRFTLRIRGAAEGEDVARELLDGLCTGGAPNYYGEQRFGEQGSNLERARAWLMEGRRPPRDRFQRKLLISTLQSAAFNAWLAKRVDAGLSQLIEGDLARKEDTGGMFHIRDVEQEQARADAWEISATGPMLGRKMRAAEAEAGVQERELLEAWGGQATLERMGRLGPGTRRVVRIRPERHALHVDGQDLLLEFTLPKGAYATIILRELMKPGDDALARAVPPTA